MCRNRFDGESEKTITAALEMRCDRLDAREQAVVTAESAFLHSTHSATGRKKLARVMRKNLDYSPFVNYEYSHDG